MAEVKTVRVEFKGDGSEKLTAQYDSVIRKDKELEQQLGQSGGGADRAAESMDGLNESLDGFNRRGPMAQGISRGLAAGLGALGGLATQVVIEGVSWAIDKLSESTSKGEDYLARFKGKADEMATALLSVENAAGLAISRLNEYNLLRANDSLRSAISGNQEKIRGQDDAIFGFRSLSFRRANADVADLLRRAGNDQNVDLAGIKAYRAELEQIGQRSEKLRDLLEPTRRLFLELEAAISATTPATVNQADVTGKLNAAYERSRELQLLGADAAAVARAGDAAYAKGRAEAAKITGISADEVERLAQVERARGEELARLAIADRQSTAAVKDGTKAVKERKEETIDWLRLASDERLLAEKMTDRAMKPIYEDLKAKDRDAEEAMQARLDLAEKEAEEVARYWGEARDEINDSWSDLWFGVFNDGKFKAGDFFKSLKSTWARTLADMIAMATQNSIVEPLFQGLLGGSGFASPFRPSLKTASNDNFAGVFDGPDSSVSDSMGGLAGKGLMGQFSSLLGGAMMGMGVGSITGSGTGGALGGAAGSLLGPIGGIVGGLIGGLIGGLFKSTPKSISSFGTDGVSGSMASGGLDVKIGKDMAGAVVRALRTFSEQLVTGLESDEFLGIVGQRGKKFFFQAQETDLKVAGKKKYGAEKFDTAEQAIAAAIEAAINSGVIKGLTDADKKLMRAAGSVEQAMADVVSSHNFKRELGFQFLGLSSPLGEAKARLEFEYQQQLILAEKYEADKTQLEAVYAAKRLALQKEYNEQLYGGLKDFLTSITAGSASPLSPTTRLNLAQVRYNELSAKARSGDEGAIGALQGAAQDYLSAGRDVFASSDGFFSIYNRVVGDISGITGVANPLGVGQAANANVAAAVNDNSRLQQAAASQAAAQRNTTNQLLTDVKALLSVTLGRGAGMPTQNGTVQVGAIDWAAVNQAIGSLR